MSATGEPSSAISLDHGVGRQRPMRHLEWHERDRHARSEHRLRGLRVGEDVELGGRRPVPEPDRAAHDRDALDAAGDARRARKRGGDVGERPRRDEGQRIVVRDSASSMMRSTASRGSTSTVGGRPSRRHRGRRRRGSRRPRPARVAAADRIRRAIGTSRMPATLHTRRALSEVFSSVWLPATTVIARSSSAGEAAASRMAIASSWPGSQSRMTRRGLELTP